MFAHLNKKFLGKTLLFAAGIKTVNCDSSIVVTNDQQKFDSFVKELNHLKKKP
jgi:hypothetical protein